MLINFSNHPSASWTREQRSTAEAVYGAVVDVPFPKVNPDASTNDIIAIATRIARQIAALQPTAVHCMGEMTLCFAVISLLQQRGIRCVASTTHRVSETLPDGSAISTFSFHRFREYAFLQQSATLSFNSEESL